MRFSGRGPRCTPLTFSPAIGSWVTYRKKEDLERFAASVIEKSGRVDYLGNNALPLMKGIDDCTWEEFSYALAVGVTVPFYLTKLLTPHFAPGSSVINISSSRERMSQPQTERFSAAKGRIAARSMHLPSVLRAKPGEQYFSRLDRHHKF